MVRLVTGTRKQKKNCEADGQSGKQRQRQNKVRTHIYIYLNEFSRMFRIKFN